MDPLRRAVRDLAVLVAAAPDEAWTAVARRFCRLLGRPQLSSDTVMELVVDVIVLDEEAEFVVETRAVVFSLIEILMCSGEWAQLTALAQVLMAVSLQQAVHEDWRDGAACWMGLAISPLTVSRACEHLPALHPERQPWLPEFVAHYTNHPSHSFGRLHFLPMSAQSSELLALVLGAMGLRNPEEFATSTDTPAGLPTRALDSRPSLSSSPIHL
jgi:hypothetical protein